MGAHGAVSGNTEGCEVVHHGPVNSKEMRTLRRLLLPVLAFATLAIHAGAADNPRTPQLKGHLVIGDGVGEFVRLAGGAQAKIVVIPTAAGLDDYGAAFQESYFRPFREKGAADIRLVHTNDRRIADSDAFIAPIVAATGVWFSGGRQWRLADAYLGTRTEAALHQLLGRGGVIGGTSAGASIQGSYLVRGDTQGALIPMGDHERGFGFLRNTAIDQHLLFRNRQFDLVEVVRAHPELLGIGIDEDACVVASGDELRVVRGYVAIYDPAIVAANGRFYLLKSGERFDLVRRVAKSEKGEPLWLPQIVPPVTWPLERLEAIAGVYRSGSTQIVVATDGARILAEPCPGDRRELIPIARDVLYDRRDGSKITVQFADGDIVSGLTWRVMKYVGERRCIDGVVVASKQRPR